MNTTNKALELNGEYMLAIKDAIGTNNTDLAISIYNSGRNEFRSHNTDPLDIPIVPLQYSDDYGIGHRDISSIIIMAIEAENNSLIEHIINSDETFFRHGLYGDTLSPFIKSIETGNTKALKMLCSKTSSEFYSHEILSEAIKHKNLSMIKIITDNGFYASEDAIVDKKLNLVSLAVESGSLDIAEYLVRCGATVSHQDAMQSILRQKNIEELYPALFYCAESAKASGSSQDIYSTFRRIEKLMQDSPPKNSDFASKTIRLCEEMLKLPFCVRMQDEEFFDFSMSEENENIKRLEGLSFFGLVKEALADIMKRIHVLENQDIKSEIKKDQASSVENNTQLFENLFADNGKISTDNTLNKNIQM